MKLILIGLVTAFLASVGFNLGLVMQKLGVKRMDQVVRRPDWATIKAFLTSPLWMAGTSITLAGYILEFVSFATAPFVLVQPVFSAGVILLAFFAVVMAKERLHFREWLGIGLCVVGAVSVGLSADPRVDTVSRAALSVERLIVSLVAVVIVALAVHRIARAMRRAEVLFGVAAGIGFTGAEMLTKVAGIELTHFGGIRLGLLAEPVVLVTIAGLIGYGLFGTFLLQVGFEHGRALVVGGVMGLTADILPMLSGLVVFGEQMPDRPFWFMLRLVGIVAAVSGALTITFSKATGHFIDELETGTLPGGDGESGESDP